LLATEPVPFATVAQHWLEIIKCDHESCNSQSRQSCGIRLPLLPHEWKIDIESGS
jgi:hypothetical protein